MMNRSTSGSWLRKFFEHGSNALIVLMILGFIAVLAWRGELDARAPFAVAGIFIFALVEYLTHRFTLHAKPARNAFIRRMQHRLHYDHHVQPDRLDLLFIPAWFLLPVVTLYGGVYFLLTGSVGITLALLLGNMLGLLYYEHVHFIAHIPVTPRTAVGRYMKKYHLWHHFKNENHWFGVTNPLFDHLFGTYRDPFEADRTGTTHNLY
jgi:4-hydroxysphinganine ceramide fatty acyl 2-hydroxylase